MLTYTTRFTFVEWECRCRDGEEDGDDCGEDVHCC